jgi:hypothetical protein
MQHNPPIFKTSPSLLLPVYQTLLEMGNFTRDEVQLYYIDNLHHRIIEVHEFSFEMCWLYSLPSFTETSLPE